MKNDNIRACFVKNRRGAPENWLLAMFYSVADGLRNCIIA
jgi:hypothetical protein